MMTQTHLYVDHVNKQLSTSYQTVATLFYCQLTLSTCPIHIFDLESIPARYSPQLKCFAQITDFPRCERSMSEHKNEEVISGVSLQPLHSGKAPTKWNELRYYNNFTTRFPRSQRLHPHYSGAVNLDDTGYNGSAMAALLTQISFPPPFRWHAYDIVFVVLTRVNLSRS